MARILAFDYGLKRVGVAASDPLQIIATTLETVPTVEIFSFIKLYTKQEEVEAFVVGFPFAHGLHTNEIAEHIEKFIAALQQRYPNKKVHKIDESFTSKIAAQTLLLSGVNKKERQKKGNTDAISANLILQTFLQMKK